MTRRYSLLAGILDYPDASLGARVERCARELDARCPAAARLLDDFRARLDSLGLRRLEESYTATFDLGQACAPYVGHQLFGEDARRSAFMVRLSEEYRAAGFSAGTELPDHVPVMLRFLGEGRCSAETARTLIVEGLLPALEKPAAELGRQDHPYAPVWRALLLVLDEAQ